MISRYEEVERCIKCERFGGVGKDPRPVFRHLQITDPQIYLTFLAVLSSVQSMFYPNLIINYMELIGHCD